MVSLTDVTLRDGLQMESTVFSLEQKKQLYDRLDACGWNRLEVTSFVHPKWVPQFGDAVDFCKLLFEGETQVRDDRMAFVPNLKGLDRLLDQPIGWAGAFVATSETFNQKNVNASVSETLTALEGMIERAHEHGRKVRVYLSTVFGCPYEGKISLDRLEKVWKALVDLGPDEIALSDTIGVAVPEQVEEVLDRFFPVFPKEKTAMHFHDTYGLALAASVAALRCGVSQFDGTTGGVGGCPYAKGASGNVAIEKLAYTFFRHGRRDHYPSDAVQRVHQYLSDELKVELHSSLFDIQRRGGDLYGV